MLHIGNTLRKYINLPSASTERVGFADFQEKASQDGGRFNVMYLRMK